MNCVFRTTRSVVRPQPTESKRFIEFMFDVMNYAERNDVEVSVRKGHDGRTVWEIFLRDHRLNMTEFTRIIDIEIRGRLDQDAYIELRCEEMMDRIRSARMKNEYAEIENAGKNEKTAQQPCAAGRFFVSMFTGSPSFLHPSSPAYFEEPFRQISMASRFRSSPITISASLPFSVTSNSFFRASALMRSHLFSPSFTNPLILCTCPHPGSSNIRFTAFRIPLSSIDT